MKIRYPIIALSMLLGSMTSVHAQISIGIESPGISIGINMPVYPNLVLIPGYPVYYNPRANSNYFFYDGLYWVYQDDNWYASSWYNGPWQLTQPEYVPLYVLRVPVRYYRQPPMYFRGWRADAPPRWGDHWGRDWEQRRSGWDRWDRRSAPSAAPLPVYQRQYSGNRYPRATEQQHSIRSEKYRYQPRDEVTQQHLQQRGNSDNPRARPQQQAPVSQRPQQQQQQQDFQANQQRQQRQQQKEQQHDLQMNQQRPPSPMQQPQRMQRPEAEQQEKGRENRADRQGRAEPQDRAEPQGRAERQDRGRESNVEQQSRDHGNKAEHQNRGRGNRIEEERGQERR